MKRAVVTICCGEFYERLAAMTHPTLKAYAEKIGADFIVWRDYAGHTIADYQKLELGKLLDRYDRVIYLDTDLLVRDDAPNLFEIVPENMLGMLWENVYGDRSPPTIRMMYRMGYDPFQWDQKYYNAGVIVLSKGHQDLFIRPTVEVVDQGAQTYLNVMIARTKTQVFPLPHRFNRMLFMDWAYGEHRCDCYFLHYAGESSRASQTEVLKRVADDLATWEQAKPDYRFARNLAFVAEGGLAENIAVEPTVRYAREVLYEHAEIVVSSAYSQLYRHLGVPVHPVIANCPNVSKYMKCWSIRHPARPPMQIKPRCVHRISLASLNLLGIELPIAYRRPKLLVDPNAAASLRRKIAPRSLNDLVVIHVGRAGADPSCTAEAWTSYSRMMVEHGCQVAVIGNRNKAEFAIAEFDTSRCLDLVDQLSLDEIIALVSEAPVLLSSDTAAVQLAGAFDHWIGLLPPTWDPEHILAWRHGSQFFKAQFLGNMPGSNPIAASAYESELPRYAGIGWMGVGPSMPDPTTVLRFVLNALQSRSQRAGGSLSAAEEMN